MTTPALKVNPIAPLENRKDGGLEQRLEEKNDVVNSFNESNINIKEMITCFKNKNHKMKNIYGNCTNLNTIRKSIDSIVFIGASSTSISLSITGFGLIVVPVSAGITCGLSLGENLVYEIVRKKIK